MKTSITFKALLALMLFLGFAYLQNSLMTPTKTPTAAPAAITVEAIQELPSPSQPSQPKADAHSDDDQGANSLDSNSVDTVAEQGLATLERIRSVPGAAPLADEIVGLLQSNPYGEFSMDNLEADENGLVELNEGSMKRMIRNDDVREKWMKLMNLVAEHPEVVAAIQGQSQAD